MRPFLFGHPDGEREKKAVRAYLWWPEGVDQDHNQPSAISSVRFRDREASEIFIVPILASEWLSLFLVRCLALVSNSRDHHSLALCRPWNPASQPSTTPCGPATDTAWRAPETK